MQDVDKETQKLIIQQEIATHSALFYRLEIRHKVSKKIGADEQVLKQIEHDLEKTLMAIKAYEEELDALDN